MVVKVGDEVASEEVNQSISLAAKVLSLKPVLKLCKVVVEFMFKALVVKVAAVVEAAPIELACLRLKVVPVTQSPEVH